METRRTPIGPVVLSVITNRPRGGPRAAEPPPGAYLLRLTMAVDGELAVRQGRAHVTLAPGDLVVHDAGRPTDVTSVDGDGVRALQLWFPRPALPLPTGRLDEVLGASMPADTGFGRLTAQFLRHVADHADELFPAEGADVSTTVLDVVARRLGRRPSTEPVTPAAARRRELLTRIRAFIQEDVDDPDLTPAGIAAAHHISVRYLHKLFREQGETVAGWIRRRRLERCRRDLGDPGMAGRPVAVIAGSHGFLDPAYFSRLFKQAYGLPPTEYRWRVQRGRP